MVERDNEDMWFECLAWADEFVPRRYSGDRLHRVMILADRVYDACKTKTRKAQAERPKLVVQVKS